MRDLKINNNYAIVIISVFFSSLIINLFIKNEIDFNILIIDLLDVENFLEYSKSELFQIVIFKRLKQLLFLLILFKAFGAEKVYSLLLVIGGGVFGILSSSQIYYQGILGLMILFALTFPQYVIYYISANYCYKVKLFCLGVGDDFFKILNFILIYVTGIICECIFLTIFLKKIYQYMVS